MMLSFAIACSNRGAPVKDCRPAPMVDKNAPTKTIHLVGQAITETINSFPILSPNLKTAKIHLIYLLPSIGYKSNATLFEFFWVIFFLNFLNLLRYKSAKQRYMSRSILGRSTETGVGIEFEFYNKSIRIQQKA